MISFPVYNRYDNKVRFTAEIDCSKIESGSVKRVLAVKWAIQNKVNLAGADLTGANLTETILSGANLTGANLTEANLTEANLTGANLARAIFIGTSLNILQTDIWTVYIQKDHIRIGCKYYSAKEWFKFTNKEIKEMDSRALAWWKQWKLVIKSIYKTAEK